MDLIRFLFAGHYVARRRDSILNCVMAFIIGVVFGLIAAGRG